MPHDPGSFLAPPGLPAAAARKPMHPVRTLAVTSGKGGVGKTAIATNLAVALAQFGHKTLLMDADLGLANVDVLLGLSPAYTLADLVDGRCTLEELLVPGPDGLLVAPAASGIKRMVELHASERLGLVQVFAELPYELDTMLVDTAAGIDASVLTFCQAAQDILMVVCDEPASMTDAYALIKLLVRQHGVERIHIVANRIEHPAEGYRLYQKMLSVCDRFLGGVVLNHLGSIPQDEWMVRAVRQRQPVVKAYPGSPSARAIFDMARTIARWGAPERLRGNVEFFVERMVDRSNS